MQQTNRPLTAPEVNKINNILTQMNAKKIPFGTLAHNGANKIRDAYIKKEEEEQKNQQRRQPRKEQNL